MSIFENFSDEQLIKYLKYVHSKINFLDDYDDDLHSFYLDFMEDNVRNIILAPLGNKELDRLDIEYLYELLLNNDSESLNEGNLDRPQLKTETIEFVSEERLWVRYTREDDVETYTDLKQDYLIDLKDAGDIDPWDWEIVDKDHYDGETDDWWFDV